MDRRCAGGRVGMARGVGLALRGLLAAAAMLAVPQAAQAVPARRLARRGVIVVVPPAEVGAAPAAAPIVVGPGPRPWWRALTVPPVPGAVVRQLPATPVPASLAPAPTALGGQLPALAKAAQQLAKPAQAAASATAPGPTSPRPSPSVAATKQPQPAAATEEIPAPQPVAAAEVASVPATLPDVAFTPAWFASHPQAWRPVEQADWWTVPDAAVVGDWLAAPVQPAAGTGADATAVTAAGGEAVGTDGLRSVLVLPAGHANQAAPTAAAGEWLPLGVFAVVPCGVAAEQATQYQQLLVDRSGTIRGNLYDDVSGTVQPIEGTIDRAALTASWAVKGSGSRFTLPVAAIASATFAPRLASVTAGGRLRDVELVPVPRP
jgi:hypothetical protein